MLYMLYDVILPELSISFSVTITVAMSPNVTDVWWCDHDVTLTLTLDPHKEKKRELNKETSIQASYV